MLCDYCQERPATGHVRAYRANVCWPCYCNEHGGPMDDPEDDPAKDLIQIVPADVPSAATAPLPGLTAGDSDAIRRL